MAFMLDHDRVCTQEVNQMYDLGCFAEQFVSYATACLIDKQGYYFVSDQAEHVYQFCQEKLRDDSYCLPVEKITRSALVQSGHRQDLRQQFKLEAAQTIRAENALSAVQTIASLASVANNVAAEVLERLQKSLNGCFDAEILQIFEGLLDEAFAARKVTPLTFWNFQKWLMEIKRDLAKDRITHDVHERIYSGFAFVQADGALGYYYNAVMAMTLERRCLMQCQKKLVTPIFQKRYCFRDTNQLNAITEDFKATLRKRLDANYLAILRLLHQLPGPVERDFFLSVYAQEESSANRLLRNTLNYYGTLWHVWSAGDCWKL